MKPLKNALCAMGAVVLLACGAGERAGGPGLETTNTLTAQVLQYNGQPVTAARVSIHGEDYAVFAEGNTDAQGFFQVELPNGNYWVRAQSQGTQRQQRLQVTGGNTHLTLLTRTSIRLLGLAPTGVTRVSAVGFELPIASESDGSFVLDSMPPGDVDLYYHYGDSAVVLSLVLFGTGDLYVRRPSGWPALAHPWAEQTSNIVWSEPLAQGEDSTWEVGRDLSGIAYQGWFGQRNFPLLDEAGERSLLLDDFSQAGTALLAPWTSALWYAFADFQGSESQIQTGGGVLRMDGNLSSATPTTYLGFGMFFRMNQRQVPVDLQRLTRLQFRMRGTGRVQTQWATTLTQNDTAGDWRRFSAGHDLSVEWQDFSVAVDTLRRLENAPGTWSQARSSVVWLHWVWLSQDQIDTAQVLWGELQTPRLYGINLSDLLLR